jgi:hypothetical protein
MVGWLPLGRVQDGTAVGVVVDLLEGTGTYDTLRIQLLPEEGEDPGARPRYAPAATAAHAAGAAVPPATTNAAPVAAVAPSPLLPVLPKQLLLVPTMA